MSSAFDHVLQRLAALERRVVKLEAAAALGRAQTASSHVAAFGSQPPGQAEVALESGSRGVGAGLASLRQPARGERLTAEPATERLHRMPFAANAPDPFPDLSQLEEKLEPSRRPAERVEVRAALEDYPRIMTRIQELWGTPECEGYLTSLVIDTRGNRRGFPPPMMEELLYLGRLARALVILGVNGDLWERYDQIGDRR